MRLLLWLIIIIHDENFAVPHKETTERTANASVVKRETSVTKQANQQYHEYHKYRAPSYLTRLELHLLGDLISSLSYIPVIVSEADTKHQITNYMTANHITTPMVYIEICLDYDYTYEHYWEWCELWTFYNAPPTDELKTIQVADDMEYIYLIIDSSGENLAIYPVIADLQTMDPNMKIIVFSRYTSITEKWENDGFSWVKSQGKPEAFYHQFHHYDVFLLTPINGMDQQRYGLFNICRFCNSGTDDVTRLNVWKSEDGFIRDVILTRSFTGLFHNSQLNVRAVRHTVNKWTPDYVRLEVLAGVIQADFHYYEYGYIRYKHVQLQGASHMRPHYNMPCTTYVSAEQMAMISHKPPRGLDTLAFVNVYDVKGWVILFTTFTVCGVALWLLRNGTFTFQKPKPRIVDSFWQLTQITLWDCINLRQNNHLAVTTLLTIYMLGMFVVISDYFGQLTSVVLVQKDDYPPIDSLEQLWWRQEVVLAHDRDMRDFTAMFLHVTNIDDRFESVGNSLTFHTVMKRILDQPQHYVTFLYRSGAAHQIETRFSDRDGNTNLHISKNTFLTRYLAYNIPKKSYYAEAVNLALCKMHAHGLMIHIDRVFKGRSLKASRKYVLNYPMIPQPSDYVHLEHLLPLFLLCGILYAAAALLLAAELLWHKYQPHMRAGKKWVRKKLNIPNMQSTVQAG